MADRRQHLRGRPLIDLPAEIQLLPEDGVGFLHVVDISLGGVGVWAQDRPPFVPGAPVKLRLALGRSTPIEIGAVVRYTRGPDRSFCGMKFDEMSEQEHSVVEGYVSALLERGSRV